MSKYLIMPIIAIVAVIFTASRSDTCPIGYELGDVIAHKTGTEGVILRCFGNAVSVDTANGNFLWMYHVLDDQVTWNQ